VQNMPSNETSPESTVEPQIALESVNFSGTVNQGSPGAAMPTDITLQLQYGDFIETTEIIDGVIDANGQFTFSNVPVLADSTYFAVVFYDGRAFVSDPILSPELQIDNTVDITLYETTTAPNIVAMTTMDIVMEYLSVPDLGEGLVTRHLNVYDNPTDYVFHLEPEGQNVRISLLMTLPVGAIILDTSQQNGLIPAQEQYAVIDTRPVYPGEHTIETSYFLPYDNQAQTVDIVVNNNFEGFVNVIIVDPELAINSEMLAHTEDINVGTEETPVMAKVYSGMLSLQAGESIIFDVEGRVISDTGQSAAAVSQNQLLPILVGVGIVTLLIIGWVVVFIRGNSKNPQREIDRIIAEIAQLEEAHDAGNINHDSFQQKRTALKKQLAELMKETESSSE